jgi:proteic killer suppression protein
VATRTVFEGPYVRGFGPEIQRRARRKLLMIDAARDVEDPRVPPGNRLEKLSGDRGGQYSVRVNDQYRICFSWSDGGAENVELVDYH